MLDSETAFTQPRTKLTFIVLLKIVAPRSHGTQTMALLMMGRSCLFLRISIFFYSKSQFFLIDDKFFCNKKTVATWKRRCVHKQSLLKSSRKKNNVRAWRQVCFKSLPERRNLTFFVLLRQLLLILQR